MSTSDSLRRKLYALAERIDICDKTQKVFVELENMLRLEQLSFFKRHNVPISRLGFTYGSPIMGRTN